MGIGSRIADKRKGCGFTQKQLAEKMGVSFQTISGWERDEFMPETEKLVVLAGILHMSLDELFVSGEVEMNWELRDRFFSEDHMYTFVESAALSRNLLQTQKALPFMMEHHEGQYRSGKAKIPYCNHPLMMACHALAMNLTEDNLLAVILLHDVCEDCNISAEELPFCQKVKEGVFAMTHNKDTKLSRNEDLKRYYQKVRNNRYASIVKLIDRCNNVSQMATGFSRKKIKNYIEETERYVIPIIYEVRKNYPEYNNAAFLIKYQMISVLESLKRILG